jgi:phosphate transport system permease protein
MEKVMDLSPVDRPKEAAPWKKTTAEAKTLSVISSIIPAVIFGVALFVFDVDFMAGLLTIFLPLQLIATGLVGLKLFGTRGINDALLIVATYFLGTFVLVLLMSVLWSVIQAGGSTLSPQFIYQNDVYVSPTTGLEIGGVGHAIIGTLLVVGLSTIITVPLALATAVYLTETRGKNRGLIRVLLQAMSGLPSVVTGLFIYSMLIVTGFTSYAGWAGSLALIPLMLPTVSRVAEESLRLVPTDLRNGALGLGASAWNAFSMVTLPAAKSGMVTAVLLGVARVIGETAPLLLTTTVANNTSINMAQGGLSTLPTYIFGYITFGYDTSIQRAWGAALVLLMLVLILFAAARIISSPKKAKKRK